MSAHAHDVHAGHPHAHVGWRAVTLPVNRWMIARGLGHAKAHARMGN